MDAYGAALPVVRLSGPTLFAPILGTAIAKAQQAWANAQAGGYVTPRTHDRGTYGNHADLS
jgi:hypothetical protein